MLIFHTASALFASQHFLDFKQGVCKQWSSQIRDCDSLEFTINFSSKNAYFLHQVEVWRKCRRTWSNRIKIRDKGKCLSFWESLIGYGRSAVISSTKMHRKIFGHFEVLVKLKFYAKFIACQFQFQQHFELPMYFSTHFGRTVITAEVVRAKYIGPSPTRRWKSRWMKWYFIHVSWCTRLNDTSFQMKNSYFFRTEKKK